MADKLRFCQIFFNLLSNAAKFTPNGGTIEFISERIEPNVHDKDGRIGIRYYVRDNGMAAITKFERSEENFYDVILMDVHMPVMDGIEATKRIRALGRSDAAAVHIIAMTAEAFDREKAQTLDAGMNAHIAKPIDVEILKKAIWSQLEKATA